MITLATASQPHGIRGEVELRLLNPDEDQSILEEGMRVFLFPSSEKSDISHIGEEWIISKIRFGNKVICQLKDVKDRTHLETLLPFEVRLPRDEFPETDENEIYLVDLIGWSVVDVDGVEIGMLKSFDDNGMQYILNVRMDDGSTISLPYVDSFFPEVNQVTKTITMILPEYSD